MHDDTLLAQKLAAIVPYLNERQRRLLLAAEARALGHGGISRVARATRVSRPTIRKGLTELDHPADLDQVRRSGGGRKQLRDRDPALVAALEALVDPDTRGDPISPLRWTCKSTRNLAETLTQQGHPVSEWVVRKLLHEAEYSLPSPSSVLEGSAHPDRDAQFRYLNEQIKSFLAQGLPVVSVDTKKKELVGAFRNTGQE